MRDTSQRKAETRQRIMAAAASLFRRDGIDGVGVDAIMREAGLTHGGFYVHFASKEELAAEVAADVLARSARRWGEIRDQQGAEEGLAGIVEAYLSAEHVRASGAGCIVPTLGAELARRPAARPGLTAALRQMIDTLTACLPGRRQTARRRALAGLACMVGAVVLARVSDDAELSDEILQAARRTLIAGEGPAR